MEGHQSTDCTHMGQINIFVAFFFKGNLSKPLECVDLFSCIWNFQKNCQKYFGEDTYLAEFNGKVVSSIIARMGDEGLFKSVTNDVKLKYTKNLLLLIRDILSPLIDRCISDSIKLFNNYCIELLHESKKDPEFLDFIAKNGQVNSGEDEYEVTKRYILFKCQHQKPYMSGTFGMGVIKEFVTFLQPCMDVNSCLEETVKFVHTFPIRGRVSENLRYLSEAHLADHRAFVLGEIKKFCLYWENKYSLFLTDFIFSIYRTIALMFVKGIFTRGVLLNSKEVKQKKIHNDSHFRCKMNTYIYRKVDNIAKSLYYAHKGLFLILLKEDNLFLNSQVKVVSAAQQASNTFFDSQVKVVSATQLVSNTSSNSQVKVVNATQLVSNTSSNSQVKAVSATQPASNPSSNSQVKVVNATQPASNPSFNSQVKVASSIHQVSNTFSNSQIKVIRVRVIRLTQQASNTPPNPQVKVVSSTQQASNTSPNSQVEVVSSTHQISNTSPNSQIKVMSSTQQVNNTSPNPQVKVVSSAHQVSNTSPSSQVKVMSSARQASNTSPNPQVKVVSSTQQASNISPNSQVKVVNSTHPVSNTSPNSQVEVIRPAHVAVKKLLFTQVNEPFPYHHTMNEAFHSKEEDRSLPCNSAKHEEAECAPSLFQEMPKKEPFKRPLAKCKDNYLCDGSSPKIPRVLLDSEDCFTSPTTQGHSNIDPSRLICGLEINMIHGGTLRKLESIIDLL